MGRYVWVPGHFELSRPHHVWVRAHWVRVGHEWVFVPGHFEPVRQPPYAQLPQNPYEPPQSGVVVPMQPPQPVYEMAPMPPSLHHEWVAGHWTHNGMRFVWVPGHFVMRRAGFVWQKAHWVPTPGGWRFVPGHFRRM